VLQEPNSIFLTKLDLDPRTWQPGTSSFTAKIRLPSNMADMQYKLALWLPDAAENLQSKPIYSVRFANEGTWDESTGYNVLGTVNVNSSAGGSAKRSDMMEVEELTTSDVTPLPTSTPAPVAQGDMLSNLQVSHDAETVYLSFDYLAGEYNAIQLLVDKDQNPDTGYRISGIGADLLFENDTWNVYAGTGMEWNWEPTEVLVLFENTGTHVNWKLSRSLLNSLQFDFVLQFVDMDWNSMFISEKETYIIQ
jgi:hypothetical protein